MNIQQCQETLQALELKANAISSAKELEESLASITSLINSISKLPEFSQRRMMSDRMGNIVFILRDRLNKIVGNNAGNVFLAELINGLTK